MQCTLLILTYFPSHAQNTGLDSLKRILKTAREDTSKVKTELALAIELSSTSPDSSIIVGNEALTLAEKIKWPLGMALSNNSIGYYFWMKGDYVSALAHYSKAIHIYEAAEQSGAIPKSIILKRKSGTFINIGLAWQGQGDYTQALDYYFKALKLKEELKDIYGQSVLLLNIGNVYRDQSNNVQALDYFLKGLKLAQEADDKSLVARLYSQVGTVYGNQDEYARALNDYLFKAMDMQEKAGDKDALVFTLNSIASVYEAQGDYVKTLEYYFKALKINEQKGAKQGQAANLGNIGEVYNEQGEYVKALGYYFQAMKMQQEIGDKSGMTTVFDDIATAYTNQKNFTQALDYYFKGLKLAEELENKRLQSVILGHIGNVYADSLSLLATPNSQLIEKSLDYYSRALKMNQELPFKKDKARNLLSIGKLYIMQHKYAEADKILHEALSTATQIKALPEIKEIYESLTTLSKLKGDYKNAFEYEQQATAARDSISNAEKVKKQTRLEMNYEFEKQQAVAKAEQDKKDALAKAEIERQKLLRNTITGGAAILIIGAITGFSLYRRRKRAESAMAVLDVEMQALRAQMNPHFIFNSLNSIHTYLLQNDNQNADQYLIKFSRLMRLILENSRKQVVPLKDDLEALELYMQLEALRMDYKFTWKVNMAHDIAPDTALIPPLLLQPIVENSIWHGMQHKEGKGVITIYISKETGVGNRENHLKCVIEDDGIGRKQSAIRQMTEKIDRKGKSMGMKITEARINIINRLKRTNAGLNFVDPPAGGLRVELTLPYEEED